MGMDKDGGMQTRSFKAGKLGKTRGWETLDPQFFAAQAERIVHELNELLVADDCPKGQRSVILLPGIMFLQTHETIGHALELDRILGYELAFAGGSFVRLEDFGKLRYGSPKLTVRADATLENSPGSFGFDDDGVPAQNNLLIDKGILVGPLLAGNGRRSQCQSAPPNILWQFWGQPRHVFLPRADRTHDQYQHRPWY